MRLQSYFQSLGLTSSPLPCTAFMGCSQARCSVTPSHQIPRQPTLAFAFRSPPHARLPLPPCATVCFSNCRPGRTGCRSLVQPLTLQEPAHSRPWHNTRAIAWCSSLVFCFLLFCVVVSVGFFVACSVAGDCWVAVGCCAPVTHTVSLSVSQSLSQSA
jgi:hypothetical protein